MSDVEEKKSGYRLEYAKNNRAKCKGSFPSQLLIIYRFSHRCTRLVTLGPKPCNGPWLLSCQDRNIQSYNVLT